MKGALLWGLECTASLPPGVLAARHPLSPSFSPLYFEAQRHAVAEMVMRRIIIMAGGRSRVRTAKRRQTGGSQRARAQVVPSDCKETTVQSVGAREGVEKRGHRRRSMRRTTGRAGVGGGRPLPEGGGRPVGCSRTVVDRELAGCSFDHGLVQCINQLQVREASPT